MDIKVGAANVTPNVADILAFWQEGNNEQLQMHINTINNVQDFMCRILTDEISPESKVTISSLLGEIVCVKDDLKKFIDKKTACNQTLSDNQ